MAPVMRDGVEYEFTTLFELNMYHQAQASKDQTNLFADKIFQITEETGALFRQWFGQGVNESDRAGMSIETPHGREHPTGLGAIIAENHEAALPTKN